MATPTGALQSTRMKRLSTLVLGLATGMAVAAAGPGAAEIQAAINDGIQLPHARWQTVENLRIEKGGATVDGSFVYLCRADLVWKLGRKELLEELQEKLDAQVERHAGKEGVGGLFKGMGSIALAVVASELGEFEAGDSVAELPVRVALVKAGDDWIVLDSAFPKGFKNPLDDVDLAGDREGR